MIHNTETLELLWNNEWISQFVSISQAMTYYCQLPFYLPLAFFLWNIFLEILYHEICVAIT